jgi:hypothetical protein
LALAAHSQGGLMDRKYKKETNRFEARDDNGNSFTIVQLTEFIEVTSRAGTQTVEGMKSLKTTTGHHVNPGVHD